MTDKDRTLNRTERLFALVLLLQNRPNMTSRELAEHFDVSRRTIFRDMRALGEAGVPLTYAEGGGYEILEGYQLPPLMFSAREAATLLIGASFTKLQPDPSLQEDADAVAMKIREVLPDSVREYIDRLQKRIVLDPYWLHAFRARPEEEGRWYDLSEAVARQRQVQMKYLVKSRGEVTQRTVDPLGLVYYTDHWNLIAYDHLREAIRNFRLDHIQNMFVLSKSFEPPEGFDLEEYLEERGRGSQNRRIRLRFAKTAYRWARRDVPAQIEDERETDDHVEITFDFENLDYVAEWLMRYGTDVEVLAPDDLQAAVREKARAVAAQYDDY
ncbi:MAG: YafY family transcriptional regulator [Bacteroidetes bacterium QS_8_64_10]|jgi:predicted DNA-binding transcriptional regulator YafY|nr:MAG: YafY family transcriptional regulator [Bacteroidetes bacterium QS_8_64_10]